MILEIDPATQAGPVGGFTIGEEIRGSTSAAIGVVNSKQGADEKNIYYSVRTKGAVGVGKMAVAMLDVIRFPMFY